MEGVIVCNIYHKCLYPSPSALTHTKMKTNVFRTISTVQMIRFLVNRFCP